MTDFTLANHGSICILTPLTDEAVEWCRTHLPTEVMTWGYGRVVEPRYVGDIVQGLSADGLSIAV
jgi:hypothetical protein